MIASQRVCICDFCSCPLTDSAWDFPARDIAFDGLRMGPDAPTPLAGCIGPWIACDRCAELVNRGARDELAQRSALRFIREHSGWVPGMGGDRGVLAALRKMHDAFWQAREGDGTHIEREQIELLARDPAFRRRAQP